MALFKNKLVTAVGTSDAAILTATTVSTIIGLSIANVTTGMITASVKLTSGATTAYLIKDAPVMPGGSLVVMGGDQKTVLAASDVLKVITSTASSADVVCSYLEV